VKVNDSARKHFTRDRLTDTDLLRAAAHPAFEAPLDDEDDPRRWLRLGFDGNTRLLEVVVLIFDSGEELIIHAMKAREQYYELLP